jgi:uncharacterized membrane protein
MKDLMQFIKSTLAGGFFVILPIALLWLILTEVIGLMDMVVQPVVELLPVDRLGGIDIARFIGLAVLLLLCFLTGAAVRTRLGSAIKGWMERGILNRVPGYTMLKSLTDSFTNSEAERLARPALVRTYQGAREIAFILGDPEDDEVTAFLPLVPTPTLGRVLLVEKDRVEMLDMPLGPVVNSLMQWGLDAKDVLARKEGE